MKKVLAAVILLAVITVVDVLVGQLSLTGDEAVAGIFEENMRIGVLLPLSGEQADLGRSAKRGVELAGVGLRSWGLVAQIEDTRCEVEYARQALNRLVESGADALIGTVCPDVANDIALLAAEQGIPFVSFDVGTSAETAEDDGRLSAQIAEPAAMADYFVSGHQARYGTDPDYAAALAFDVLTALTMELRDNTGGADELYDHLRVMSHYGVSGTVTFR
ncbi:MAG: ABC transporter substrate-binding protein [Patescibacteria group bacterium]